MVFIILGVLAAFAAIYAFSLKRREERRQEWRQESRAAWQRG